MRVFDGNWVKVGCFSSKCARNQMKLWLPALRQAQDKLAYHGERSLMMPVSQSAGAASKS